MDVLGMRWCTQIKLYELLDSMYLKSSPIGIIHGPGHPCFCLTKTCTSQNDPSVACQYSTASYGFISSWFTQKKELHHIYIHTYRLYRHTLGLSLRISPFFSNHGSKIWIFQAKDWAGIFFSSLWSEGRRHGHAWIYLYMIYTLHGSFSISTVVSSVYDSTCQATHSSPETCMVRVRVYMCWSGECFQYEWKVYNKLTAFRRTISLV